MGKSKHKRTISQTSPNSVSANQSDKRQTMSQAVQSQSPSNSEMYANAMTTINPTNNPHLAGNMSMLPTNTSGINNMNNMHSQAQSSHYPTGMQMQMSGSGNIQPFDPQQYFAMILDRLTSMDTRLNKLDSIEAQMINISGQVTQLDTRLVVVENKVRDSNNKLNEIEASRNFESQSLDEIKVAQDRMAADFTNLESLRQENVKLSEEVIDLQSRSMRPNLLFFNFVECANDEERRMENCREKILDFCENPLGMNGAKQRIKIDGAHRIGRFVAGKKRPIVVRFNYRPDKDDVKLQAREKLRDSEFRVSDQFPRIIQERRRQLIPELIKAKQEGKRAVLSYDKLYIEGRLFTPTSH